MTILVPTDFSENANHATEYAIEIAKATNGRLILLHVLTEAIEENAMQKKLNVLLDAINEVVPEVKCETSLSKDEIVTGILGVASQRQVDLIVMGTKGASNLSRLFFGSNTASIIEKANCTVLSVPGNYSFKKPERMLFSTNFTREDLKAAVEFVNLAKAFQSSVIIAHVSVEQDREEVETSLIQIFSKEVSDLTDYDNISCKVSTDNTISLGLDTLISETHADVIALSTRKRRLLEKIYNPSLTQKYSLQADIPLLAFHNASTSA